MTGKAKKVKKPKKLTSYWKIEWRLCILIALSGLIYNFGMLISPYFEGFLVDTLSSGNKDSIASLPFYLWIFILLIVIVEIARSLKRYFVRRFANNTLLTMRTILCNNLLNKSFVKLQKEDIGSTLSRLTSDCTHAVEGMRKLTTEIFDTLTLFLFYNVYLFLIDIRITLFALIPVALAILFAFSLRKKVYLANQASRKSNAEISGLTYSLFDQALMFRIYSRDEDNLKKYDLHLKDYEKKTVFSSVLESIISPVSNVIALLGLIPIVIFGSEAISTSLKTTIEMPLLNSSIWTIGIFTSYITAFVLLASKASKTAKLFTSIEKGLSSWKRIEPYIDVYKDYCVPVEREGDDLVIQNLSLPIDDRILFHSLNLEAKKGEIIGITGLIASGKSAFGKVFLQELPYQGSISLFSNELKEYSLSEIKGNIVYMGHHSDLTSDTIKNNIALGDSKEVASYLSLVSFDKDLESMPEKENTLVGNEGMKLSGGQQERLSLARTLYHKKSLIILDDPFASVDIKTEHEIMKKLRKEANDSIILLFSHRLSYFPYCDKVIVINKDKSVSVSDHETLLKENPTYQELYKLQKAEVEHE